MSCFDLLRDILEIVCLVRKCNQTPDLCSEPIGNPPINIGEVALVQAARVVAFKPLDIGQKALTY